MNSDSKIAHFPPDLSKREDFIMSMNDKTIIRTIKKTQYVTINNSVFTDSRLSWKAKGIMGYLLSRPDDWKVIIGNLVKQSKDGRDAVYSGLKELKEYGYLEHHPVRRQDGKKTIIGWEYIVHEEPIETGKEPLTENPEVDKKQLDYPLTDFPYVDNPDVDNPTLQSTNSTNDLKSLSTDKTHTEAKAQTLVCVDLEDKGVTTIIQRAKDALGVSVDREEVSRWLATHDEAYLLDKIALVASQGTSNAHRSLRGAIKNNWQWDSTSHGRKKSVGASDQSGGADRGGVSSVQRVVPAVQPGKYERFYQVYGRGGLQK